MSATGRVFNGTFAIGQHLKNHQGVFDEKEISSDEELIGNDDQIQSSKQENKQSLNEFHRHGLFAV
jgi:hypothetical protein